MGEVEFKEDSFVVVGIDVLGVQLSDGICPRCVFEISYSCVIIDISFVDGDEVDALVLYPVG